jgi:L-fuconolactonase
MSANASLVVDAHHHYWWQARRPHRWPAAAGSTLERDFTPLDLEPEMRKAGVDGAILMQSLNDSNETAEFLSLAASSKTVLGVVGWVPLDSPEIAARALDQLAPQGKLVGVRHLINFEPDPHWLLQDGVLASIEMLMERRLVFDVVPVNATQFEAVLSIAERNPSLRIVIDHLARPPIGQSQDQVQTWRTLVTRAAAHPNISIKLSVGLDVLMGWSWSTEQLRPYAEHVLEAFGADRVLAASNWPVSNLAADYQAVWSGIRNLTAQLSSAQRAAVMGGNAVEVFNLETSDVLV